VITAARTKVSASAGFAAEGQPVFRVNEIECEWPGGGAKPRLATI